MKIHNIVDSVCVGVLAQSLCGFTWTFAAIVGVWALVSAIAETYDDRN